MARLGQAGDRRRAGGELERPGERRLLELVGRHDPVDQADAQRLVGLDLAAGEDQVLGPGRADEAGAGAGCRRRRG